MAFGREPRFENPGRLEGTEIDRGLSQLRFSVCVEHINKAQAETEEKIEMSDFSNEDVFGPEELERGESIERDKQTLEQYLARIQERFNRLSPEEQRHCSFAEQMAKALEEYVICEQLNLGDDVFFSRASQFDDVVKGKDVVIEIAREGQESLFLALDITAQTRFEEKSAQGQTAKLGRCLNFIDGTYSHASEVRYYHSPVDDKRQRIRSIVPVIVGMDWQNMQEVFSLTDRCLTAREQGDRKKAGELQDQIREHLFQDVILDEILYQLRAYEVLAQNSPQSRYTAEQIRELQKGFQSIKDQREEREKEVRRPDKVLCGLQAGFEGGLAKRGLTVDKKNTK